jgi:hypothetical protein
MYEMLRLGGIIVRNFEEPKSLISEEKFNKIYMKSMSLYREDVIIIFFKSKNKLFLNNLIGIIFGYRIR